MSQTRTEPTPTVPTAPRPGASWQSWLAYALAWAQTSPTDWDAAARPTTRPVAWPVTWHAYRELTPGPRWQALWRETETAYRAWYLSEGESARPSLDECERALRRHMPELVSTWQEMVRLTGGDDVAARLLTMWRTPVFAAGCTQVTLPGADPALLRTYDYDPALSEAVIASTDYSGDRAVLGTSDVLWGLVDGMNADGLAVSLTYGGRPGGGEGFAIPLVLRYLLETTATVREAIAVLRRLPIAQAYNIALVDPSGDRATVFVAPGEEPQVSDLAVSTNHRLSEVEHPEIASPLRSLERQQLIAEHLAAPDPRKADPQQGDPRQADGDVDQLASLEALFAEPPIHADRYEAGFGSLYTVTYRPARGQARYVWGEKVLTRSFDDEDAEFPVVLRSR